MALLPPGSTSSSATWGNIRYSRELEGSALNDVGCYPIRLAAEFFGVPHEAAWADATWCDGVDVDTSFTAAIRHIDAVLAGTRNPACWPWIPR